MKFTTKTIACGMVAMALVACSDNENISAAPQETSQNQTSQEKPQDTTSVVSDSIPAISDSIQILPESIKTIEDSATSPESGFNDSLREQYYESLLRDDFVSNMIAVDCINEEFGLGPCLDQRDSLPTGKVLINNFNGFDRLIGCQQGDSTLLHYSLFISYSDVKGNEMRIKKRLIGNDKHVTDVFQKDCNQEGGTYSLDEDGMHLCTILPADSTDDFFINYIDPNWAKYAGTAINICKDQPVNINPNPSDTAQSQTPSNKIKTGECKENALAKPTENSVASSEGNVTLTKIGEGSYEIMIPDVEDNCEIYSGVVRTLAGDTLTIQYDFSCKLHSEHSKTTDTEPSTDTNSILYQYDESCVSATTSNCICTSDHYFQVNEALLKGAKHVLFEEKVYTIGNPLD